ncbi:MAG: hypothetical protein HYV29_11645 [Ignavibacteriales bacterium]|nr:hypothetical protein [Ignavibacteriales bacterium]
MRRTFLSILCFPAVFLSMVAQEINPKIGLSTTVSSSPTIGVRLFFPQSFDIRFSYSFLSNSIERDISTSQGTQSLEMKRTEHEITLGIAAYLAARILSENTTTRLYVGINFSYNNQQQDEPVLQVPSFEYTSKTAKADLYGVSIFAGNELVLFEVVSVFGEAGILYSTGKIPSAVLSNPSTTTTSVSGNIGMIYYFN